MGNLQALRVQSAKPFFTTAIDFCGPFYSHFKVPGKQPRKCYAEIFCCGTTKAVPIEIVSDPTTDAFFGALRRLVSRRGNCRRLYCDNATSFVGVKNKLAELAPVIHSGCTILFNPPQAPHFGGLFETAIKSAKHLFYKSVAAVSLTYDELETVNTEIKAILISRPLTSMQTIRAT